MLKTKLYADYKSLKKQLEGKKMTVETGIFTNKLAKNPNYKVKKAFLSSTINSLGKQSSNTVASTLQKLENRYKIISVFFVKSRQQSTLLAIISNYFLNPKANLNRLQNAITSLIILPITKKQYGNNSVNTILQKGFNWKFINTGQTIKSIKTKVVKNDNK